AFDDHRPVPGVGHVPRQVFPPFTTAEDEDIDLFWLSHDNLLTSTICAIPAHSILKFFQVDNVGMLRMTSSARYFKEGVGARRPNWRWIMCFLEWPKANTWCKACVKRCSCS